MFLNCDKRLDLKAMVRRISILLLRRSRKLSKSSTPLRTLVAKTLYLATWCPCELFCAVTKHIVRSVLFMGDHFFLDLAVSIHTVNITFSTVVSVHLGTFCGFV